MLLPIWSVIYSRRRQCAGGRGWAGSGTLPRLAREPRRGVNLDRRCRYWGPCQTRGRCCDWEPGRTGRYRVGAAPGVFRGRPLAHPRAVLLPSTHSANCWPERVRVRQMSSADILNVPEMWEQIPGVGFMSSVSSNCWHYGLFREVHHGLRTKIQKIILVPPEICT